MKALGIIAAAGAFLVGARFLLAMPARDDLADFAKLELKKWKGLTDEDPRALPLLEKYWRPLGHDSVPAEPWSAAFVSYVARKWDPKFPADAAHSLYAGRLSKPWKILRPENARVRRSDIILRNRGGGSATFEDIGRDFFPSHADIVTATKRGSARAVGGNKIGGTVGVEEYALDSSGRLADSRAIAILRRS